MTAWLLALTLLGAANADDLAARAHKAEAALEYEDAAHFWLEVLALPDLPVHRRVEAHLQLATAFAVLGDQEGARTHLRRAIKDDATAKLPPDAPAKVQVLFQDVSSEARARAAETRDQGPWIASTIALTAGVASGVTAGVLFVLAAGTDTEALAEPAQVKRQAIYDRRDALIWSGDVAAVGGLAFLVVAGVGFTFVALPQPGQE